MKGIYDDFIAVKKTLCYRKEQQGYILNQQHQQLKPTTSAAINILPQQGVYFNDNLDNLRPNQLPGALKE